MPDFLKPFEADLKKYEREALKITASPINANPLEDKLELKDSKFLGAPFFPVGNTYPTDKNGKPMVLLAQLNFEQIPNLENFPKDGILQLFLSAESWYDDGYKIIYLKQEDLEKNPVTDFSFLEPEDYEDIPVHKPHKLSFEKITDKGSCMDSQFDYSFDDMDYWDFAETLEEDQKAILNNYFDASGHKLGGYAEFTQEDPRENSPETFDDIQLLQIDTDKHIMFGDGGIAHIFINKENLMKKDFSKAYFYWDCF